MDEGFTPADVARRVAALGVIVNPAVVWSYLRTRFGEQYSERLTELPPARLPVAQDELDEWLDDFLDGVERTRARLAEAMQRDAQGAGPDDM